MENDMSVPAKKLNLAALPAALPAASFAVQPAPPARKAAGKTAVKAASKVAVKPTPAVAKVAVKVVGKVAAKAAPEAPSKAVAAKAPKIKLVRDSFTIPSDEYALLGELKQRSLAHAHPVKKSELLRAGIKLLATLSDTALLRALKNVPVIKTGRPKAKKGD